MFMTIERSYLLADLRRFACEVIFQKADGSSRTMRCTLNPVYMPEGTATAIQEPTNANVVVWDLERNDWRSFNTKRIYSIQQVNTV